MADTVLIVDDDEAVLTMLRKVMRSSGIDSEVARSGKEAIELTRTRAGRPGSEPAVEPTADL